jgi:hypothetical protein
MDMSMGMGMDSGSAGIFTPTNMRIARLYWYLIAAVVGLLACRRITDTARRTIGSVVLAILTSQAP